MNAKLLGDGTLVISPENELEHFALKAWLTGRKAGRAKLLIDEEATEVKGWAGVREFNQMLADLGPRAKSYKQWCDAGCPMPDSSIAAQDNAK